MSRPVNNNSKDPRYWYFRMRYLAKKRGEKFSGKMYGPHNAPVVDLPPEQIMTEAQWRAAKRPSSSVTWNELSSGASNS